ncbi:hypothetical protein N7460_001855 [Penicillium canescens]|uniref:Arrestin-like N-terminal domain-containing protein n=1 Tax=Penicillium canescens TaxID=5083 RepID=A0AAD6IIV1_PENCN|nr:hypothetical protein N7460_001855 [Penicillium canescens]KAJ6065082.1 hypothetical protein N7444_000735 [Penicillium canescens]
MTSSSYDPDAHSLWMRRQRCNLKIDLAEEKTGAMKTYTSGDPIEGVASITCDCDTPFDEIQIVLEGLSNTTLERTPYPGQTGCRKTFLAMRYPVNHPQVRVFERGRSYQFPFTFIFPDRLLPHVCYHSMRSTLVQQHHTVPPPTLGDHILSGSAESQRDDMTPGMCQISYHIRVAVTKRQSSNDHGFQLATQKILRIIPSVENDPIPEEFGASRYSMQLETEVKRGLFNGKLGRLILSSALPKPVQLDPLQCMATNEVSTTVTVKLRFDPQDDQLPPRLERMDTKLKAHTFFTAVPWSDFPHLSEDRTYPKHSSGDYTESMRLSTRSITSVRWEKCFAADPISIVQGPVALTNHGLSSSNTYYTTSMIVPITLPQSKAFPPTFHSCLVSRIYSLDIALSYCNSKPTLLPATLSLRVPLLIKCQPRVEFLRILPKATSLQSILDEPLDSTETSPPYYA